MKNTYNNLDDFIPESASEDLKETRLRIEHLAAEGEMPSLELSVEYLNLFRMARKEKSDECLRAIGYFVFLRDYIFNPLSLCRPDVDDLDPGLYVFLDCELNYHNQKDIWSSAFAWRRAFADVDETPVDPLFSVKIGSHCIRLEKSYDDFHEHDVYRVEIDGYKTFWMEDHLECFKDMNTEFITRDLLYENNTKALLEMDLDADAVNQIFAYFKQVKCRVCSKRFDYDGLYSPMLTDERWKDVYEHYGFTENDDSFENDDSLYICLECMEKALGRELVREDVNDSQYNENYLKSRGWM